MHNKKSTNIMSSFTQYMGDLKLMYITIIMGI